MRIRFRLLLGIALVGALGWMQAVSAQPTTEGPFHGDARKAIVAAVEHYYDTAWDEMTAHPRTWHRPGMERVHTLPTLRRGFRDALMGAGKAEVALTADGDVRSRDWIYRVYLVSGGGFTSAWGISSAPTAGLLNKQNDTLLEDEEGRTSVRWVAFAWPSSSKDRRRWAYTSNFRTRVMEGGDVDGSRMPLAGEVIRFRHDAGGRGGWVLRDDPECLFVPLSD